MISLSEREQILRWIDEAAAQGARRQKACELLGIRLRTLQRWRQGESPVQPDRRTQREVVAPHKLTESERAQMLAVANSAEFASLSPSQFVPILAERGDYIASESSFYRLLRQNRQLNHRQASRPSQARHKPTALCATAPNQIYSWDITYLKTVPVGMFFYLYLVLDIYSRKIVGWCVQPTESSDYAAALIAEIAQREGLCPDQLVLHSDNGAPMKGATLLATLHSLGITPSFSRPAVSNDNPYSESLFRTTKYRPDYPTEPFVNLEQARDWVARFVQWYNQHHRHSAIRFVTPAQRHDGLEALILKQRQDTYAKARARHPQRWSGQTRNWKPVGDVLLNPDRHLHPSPQLSKETANPLND